MNPIPSSSHTFAPAFLHRLLTVTGMFALAGLDVPAQAGIYYASPVGSDNNPGTQAQPWRSLQKAANSVSGGDLVLIADGTYPAGIVMKRAGRPGAPIHFRAVNPGKAVIDGSTTTERDAFVLQEAHNVLIDGLRIERANRAAIWVSKSNNVTIRRVQALHNQKWGIFTSYSDNVLLEYNECGYSGAEHGIYVSNGGDRPIVRYNRLHNNARAGVQLNGDGKQVHPTLGSRGDGIIDRAQVIGNIIWGNGTGGAAGINLACVTNSMIANNLLFNNVAGGISLFNDNRADAVQWGSKNNYIVSNTIYFAAGEGRWCMSFTNGSSGNLVQNNILSGGYNGSFQFDNSSPFVSDNNLHWSLRNPDVAVNVDTNTRFDFAEWQSKTGNDRRSFRQDPQFVSTSGLYDFHVRPGSSAVGGGAHRMDVPVDMNGLARSVASRADIGCYEY